MDSLAPPTSGPGVLHTAPRRRPHQNRKTGESRERHGGWRAWRKWSQRALAGITGAGEGPIKSGLRSPFLHIKFPSCQSWARFTPSLKELSRRTFSFQCPQQPPAIESGRTTLVPPTLDQPKSGGEALWPNQRGQNYDQPIGGRHRRAG